MAAWRGGTWRRWLRAFRKWCDEDYLRYRIRSTEYLGEKLLAAGIQIVEPPGGHAIYVDAAEFCPHIPPEQFPGQALVCASIGRPASGRSRLAV